MKTNALSKVLGWGRAELGQTDGSLAPEIEISLNQPLPLVATVPDSHWRATDATFYFAEQWRWIEDVGQNAQLGGHLRSV